MQVLGYKNMIVALVASAFLAGLIPIGCSTAPKNPENNPEPRTYDSLIVAKNRLGYQPGDEIPHEFVCMKTDQYREMRQLLVEYEGRAYYGCCEKCSRLIPENPSMRIATDPLTGEPVDKATAFIVLTGNNDQVMYFSSKETYRRFLSGAGK